VAVRDSLFVQASGPTGMLDVEECRVGLGALWTPHGSAVKAKSGFRPGPLSGTSTPGQVSATGTPDGYVHVAPFQLVLQSGRAAAAGTYVCTLDATYDVNILSTPANPTNPRNDLIVARQSDTFYTDGTSPFEILHIVGTPAGSPSDPAIGGSSDHIPLARVRVDAGATTIVSGKITDLRGSGHAKSLVGGIYAVAAGGILPVASQAERDALTGIYGGFAVWRSDRGWVEIYTGSGWRVQGVPHCTSVADLSAITSPYTSQLAVVVDRIYRYTGTGWVPIAPGYVDETTRTSSVGPFTNTETLLDQITFSAVAGARYKLTWDGTVQSSVANDLVALRPRWKAGATLDSAGTLFTEREVNIDIAARGMGRTVVATVTGITAGQASIGILAVRTGGTGNITAFGDATRKVTTLLEIVG